MSSSRTVCGKNTTSPKQFAGVEESMAATAAALPARMSAEERQTRLDLAACYRLVDLFGWSDLINTRITARVPGADDHFLLNPYGLLFDEVTASSLVKIDVGGNPVEPSTYDVNSGGFAIPGAVHMARRDAACVVHTHSVAGCAVSMQKDGLLPLNQHALQVIGDVAYHDYEGTARNPEERARLLADLGDRRIMVLRNHGLLVVGSSIAGAFIATYRMERACAMQLAFQQSGAELHPIGEAVVQAAFSRAGTRFAGGGIADPAKFEWPALLRKLDRIDPSYKQ
jgi:ribulose-5-phosphate 4-epimerase/fuculose-1-phosphate aldolase